MAVFGILAIPTPGCSYFSYYYSILQCFSGTTMYSLQANIGFVIAIAGAVLFVVGEVGRRTRSASNPPIT